MIIEYKDINLTTIFNSNVLTVYVSNEDYNKLQSGVNEIEIKNDTSYNIILSLYEYLLKYKVNLYFEDKEDSLNCFEAKFEFKPGGRSIILNIEII